MSREAFLQFIAFCYLSAIIAGYYLSAIIAGYYLSAIIARYYLSVKSSGDLRDKN